MGGGFASGSPRERTPSFEVKKTGIRTGLKLRAVLSQTNHKRDRLEDAMNLELELSYRAEVKMPVTVGAGPYGTRLFFEVLGGSFEGKRLNGKMLTGGGD
jgi:hypothetical protein